MSFATSQPLINKFFGGVDVATLVRTHLLANASDQKVARFRVVANAVRAAAKVHPVRITRTLRRVQKLSLDLVN